MAERLRSQIPLCPQGIPPTHITDVTLEGCHSRSVGFTANQVSTGHPSPFSQRSSCLWRFAHAACPQSTTCQAPILTPGALLQNPGSLSPMLPALVHSRGSCSKPPTPPQHPEHSTATAHFTYPCTPHGQNSVPGDKHRVRYTAGAPHVLAGQIQTQQGPGPTPCSCDAACLAQSSHQGR